MIGMKHALMNFVAHLASREKRAISAIFKSPRVGAVVFVVAIMVGSLFVTSTASAAPKQGGRYLFLIETSSAMSPEKAAIKKSIDLLIQSGLNGQMKYGDTIGVWTYSDKLNTDCPMIMWRGEHAQDIDSAINEWLSQQKYSHRAQFSNVQPALQKVINVSEKLMIIWISSGDDSITNTPFDKQIGELHKEFRDSFRKDNIPFVTLLAVRRGEVRDYTVNPGDAKVRLPDILQKEAQEDAAKAAAAAALAAQTPPPPSKPPLVIKIGPDPEILAAKSNAMKEAAAAVLAATNVPAAAPAITNSNATTAVVSPQTNTAAVTNSQTNAVVAAVPQTNLAPPSVVAPTVKTNAVIASNAPLPAAVQQPIAVTAPAAKTNVAVVSNTAVASNVSTPLTSSVPAIVSKPTTSPRPSMHQPRESEPVPAPTVVASAGLNWTYLGTALGLLALVGGFVIFLILKSGGPKGPSFISQSMTRERLNSGESTPSSDNPGGHD